MAVCIITDSGCDMTQEEAQKLGVTVLPLYARFGNETFRDGIDMTKEEFYTRLRDGKVFPQTSQVSPFDYERAFAAAAQRGEEVLCITISAKLSGCYQSALIAAAEHPGTVVVDSESVTIGIRVLVDLALELRAKGLNAALIGERLEAEKKNVCVLALLDTMEYLRRGGRISTTVAVAGSLLSIKPVITAKDGRVALLGKARGSKNGRNLLREICRKQGIRFDRPVRLGYSGLNDARLQEYLEDSKDLYEGFTGEMPVSVIGCGVGTHVGPDGVSVAFFRAKG